MPQRCGGVGERHGPADTPPKCGEGGPGRALRRSAGPPPPRPGASRRGGAGAGGDSDRWIEGRGRRRPGAQGWERFHRERERGGTKGRRREKGRRRDKRPAARQRAGGATKGRRRGKGRRRRDKRPAAGQAGGGRRVGSRTAGEGRRLGRFSAGNIRAHARRACRRRAARQVACARRSSTSTTWPSARRRSCQAEPASVPACRGSCAHGGNGDLKSNRAPVGAAKKLAGKL